MAFTGRRFRFFAGRNVRVLSLVAIGVLATFGGLVGKVREARADEAKNDASKPEKAQEFAALPSMKPWVLFDPHRSRREIYLQGGYVAFRPVDTNDTAEGIGLSLGETIQNRRGHLWVGGRVQSGIRVLSKSTYWAGLYQYSYQGGLAFGPIEVDARFGVTLLHADLQRGTFSLGGLSPRAAVGFAAVIGKHRVGIEGYSELLWRWFGEANVRSTGITLEWTTHFTPEKP